MKALVSVKRVIDPYAKVKPSSDGMAIDVSGVKFEINPFDEIAVEAAVQLKELGVVTEIVVVSIGASECEEQLRKALAMGADRAILVETSETLDSLGVAKELEFVARDEQPALILMGKQATDDDCNQVGQMLAARLDWPQITFAAKIVVSGSNLIVTRETDSGEEVAECSMPCVVTTDLRLNEPRYIALPGIIKARSKPLARIQAKVNSAPKTRVVRYEAPAERAPGRKVGSVAELVAALKGEGAL